MQPSPHYLSRGLININSPVSELGDVRDGRSENVLPAEGDRSQTDQTSPRLGTDALVVELKKGNTI